MKCRVYLRETEEVLAIGKMDGLKPFTAENAKENQRKSVASRKRNKTVADTARKMLYSEVTDPKQRAIIAKAGLPVGEHPTYLDFLVASAILKSIKKGGIDELLKLAELLGEQPVSEGNGNDKKAFNALMEAIKNDEDN